MQKDRGCMEIEHACVYIYISTKRTFITMSNDPASAFVDCCSGTKDSLNFVNLSHKALLFLSWLMQQQGWQVHKHSSIYSNATVSSTIVSTSSHPVLKVQSGNIRFFLPAACRSFTSLSSSLKCRSWQNDLFHQLQHGLMFMVS